MAFAKVSLDLPPPELQAKMRRQQLERNAEIAEQTQKEREIQREQDRQNYWRTQQQLSIQRENDYRQRMQQIQEDSYRQQMDITCFSRLPGARGRTNASNGDTISGGIIKQNHKPSRRNLCT